MQVGEPRRQRRPQLLSGQRALGEQPSREREHGAEVDVDEARCELAVPGQLGVEDRLRERSQVARIVRGDEVDRPPQGDDAHERTVLEAAPELVGVEAVEP